MSKIDLDEIERAAREWGDEDADWYPGVGPKETLALIANIHVLEAERDATRRQADAATINLGNARDAHQEELGRAAAIEVRLTERVAELEAEADRAVTIADEAFGLGPVESLDATLSRIERGIFEQHKRIAGLEQLVERLRCGDLHTFHDGELEPDRAEAFREHLGRCATCAAGLDGLMQEMVATEPGRRRWAPQACVDAIACAECGAARGVRCSTDRPLHTSRWDAWKVAGFPEVAP